MSKDKCRTELLKHIQETNVQRSKHVAMSSKHKTKFSFLQLIIQNFTSTFKHLAVNIQVVHTIASTELNCQEPIGTTAEN